MSASGLRTAGFSLALLVAAFGTAALAHNDPREMGAGPGAPEAAHQTDAPGQAEMDRLATEGAMPMMADGTAPVADSSDAAMPEMDHGTMSGMEGMDHGQDADNANKTFGQRLFAWLGKLHIVAIHFPIALIVGAFGVEVVGLRRKHHIWRSAARTMLVIGAFGAVIAASLGWFAGGFYLTDRNLVLTAHRYLGMAIAISSVLLAWAGLRRFDPAVRDDRIFAALLGLLALAVLVQGFLGGTFMHGGMRHMML